MITADEAREITASEDAAVGKLMAFCEDRIRHIAASGQREAELIVARKPGGTIERVVTNLRNGGFEAHWTPPNTLTISW